MSASREKKLRQGTGGYSPKAARARQEAAEYRRKAGIYTAIGVVVTVLVAALLLWNSGLFQRQKVAVTVGGTDYKVNELSYYYHLQSSRYLYSMYGLLDPSLSDEEQIYSQSDNQTYRDLFLSEATDALTRVTAFYDKALAEGYTEAQVKERVDETIADWKADATASGYSYASFLKANFGQYMTTGDFKRILTRAAVADAYYQDLTDSFTYEDTDYQSYYAEHANELDTFEYSQLYFKASYAEPVNEDGSAKELSEEEKAELQAGAMAEAKEKAEKALADLKDGQDIAALISTYEPSSSSDHLVAVGSTLSSSPFGEDLYQYEVGQSGLVEATDSGYYVIVLHARHRDETATRDTRHILIRPQTSVDSAGTTVAPTQGAWDEAKVKAEDILAQYESSDKTADSFAALAEAHSEDSGSNTNGGLYEGVSQGSFVPVYDSWLFDETRTVGDVTLIRHEAGEDDANPYWGYHIVYFAGDNVPVWQQSADNALRSEAVNAATEELTADYDSMLGDGASYLGK